MSHNVIDQTPVPIGVGFDTARYGHHVSFLREDKQRAAEPFHFTESREGYQQLDKALQQMQRRYGHVHWHMRIDAAGQYATNLETFLRSLPMEKTISLGQPKQNKSYCEVHYPKRKADPVESHACARYAIVERPSATLQAPAQFRQLQEIAGAMQSQVRQSTRLTNQLHNRLSRVFPELALITNNLAAAWVLKLLQNYPTAPRIAAARCSSLTAIGHLSQQKAEQIQSAARQTTGSLKGKSVEQLIRTQIAQLQQSLHAEKELKKLLERAYEQLPASNHLHIESISGIGKTTAAALVAKIVSIDRFETAEKLVGYFGVFPEERHVSGTDKYGKPKTVGTMRMSQKGNDLVRGLLWMAAQSALKHNAAIKPLYARLRARNVRGDVALGHCMQKLLHLVFAVWKTGKPFDAEHYPWCKRSERQSSAEEMAAGHNKGRSPKRKVVTATNRSVPASERSINDSTAATEAPQNRKGPVDFALLRGQVTLKQVLQRIGQFQRLAGNGSQRRGPCPVHAAGTKGNRSFSVNLDKNVFQCFEPSCAIQGNVLDLWMALHNLPLYEAAIDLAETFRIQLQNSQPTEERQPVVKTRKSK